MRTTTYMSAEEIQLKLEVMAREDDEITKILEGLLRCPDCGRGRKEGADFGCRSCVARDVMTT